MGQDEVKYVKIIDNPFRPMNMPVDTVWQCTNVIADYVIATGAGIATDSEGTPVVMATASKAKAKQVKKPKAK